MALGILPGSSKLDYFPHSVQRLGPAHEGPKAHAKGDRRNIPAKEKGKIREQAQGFLRLHQAIGRAAPDGQLRAREMGQAMQSVWRDFRI